MNHSSNRRIGDAVSIEGGYQHRALTAGHPVQRFWHFAKQLAITRLMPPAPGDFVLDIGCGSGVISDHLARAGATVLAVDGNADAIAFARHQYGSPQIEFRLGLIDEHFHLDRPVDKIYCLELIEHIHYPQARTLLDHARAVLRPGGRIFLTTPNYHSAWPAIEWLMDRTGATPKLAGAQHVEFYNVAKLRRLLVESGFEVQRLTTKCGLAPWVAPLSWGLATRLQEAELRSRWTFGSVLVCVARTAG
jgi:2-polyprenyl-3-methyl-5-hydroxy-6-metoxy-1,4-benzoquinol methylase